MINEERRPTFGSSVIRDSAINGEIQVTVFILLLADHGYKPRPILEHSVRQSVIMLKARRTSCKLSLKLKIVAGAEAVENISKIGIHSVPT